MIVLSLDSATDRIGVGLLLGSRALQEFHRGGDRSSAILPMIDSILARRRLTLGQLDRIAVAVGPGSFTGLRVGIATVLGLVAPLARPPATVGVSTLVAIREAARLAGRGIPDGLALLPFRKGEWSVGFPDGREEVVADADLPAGPRLVGWKERLPEAIARIGAAAEIPAAALVPRYLRAPYAS